jgi:hypothetical protein
MPIVSRTNRRTTLSDKLAVRFIYHSRQAVLYAQAGNCGGFLASAVRDKEQCEPVTTVELRMLQAALESFRGRA